MAESINSMLADKIEGTIGVQEAAGKPYNIYLKVNKKIVAWVKITSYYSEGRVCDIIFIYSSTNRKGYATALINFLKKSYDKIHSDWFASTQAGKKLLRKNGFIKKKNLITWSRRVDEKSD